MYNQNGYGLTDARMQLRPHSRTDDEPSEAGILMVPTQLQSSPITVGVSMQPIVTSQSFENRFHRLQTDQLRTVNHQVGYVMPDQATARTLHGNYTLGETASAYFDNPINALQRSPDAPWHGQMFQHLGETASAYFDNQVNALQRPPDAPRLGQTFQHPNEDLTDQINHVELRDLVDTVEWSMPSEANGCRTSSWKELPGRPGSLVRIVEVLQPGQGLAFFRWTNHKRLQHPELPEMKIQFANNSVPGGPYYITLEPGDAFGWCPAKYMWPMCVICDRFLFPCEMHRNSQKHQCKIDNWLGGIRTLPDLHATWKWYGPGFVKKNVEGLRSGFS
jgi:hypothetical protein